MPEESGEPNSAAMDAYRKKIADAQARQQADAQVRSAMRAVLDAAAYERLSNIKISNAELYAQLVQVIAYLYQNGQLKGKVGEEQLKELVSRIISKRRETTIRRI
ncbi:MAG: DNA-binding protein [Candidatus Micrarchaeia archaeon]|jgi:programmed cell death protein 5